MFLSPVSPRPRPVQTKVRFMAATDPAIRPEAVAEALTSVSAANPKPQVRFGSSEEVEIVARLVRKVMTQPVRDHHTLVAAESVLMAGLRVFPEEAMLNSLHSSFAFEVLADASVRLLPPLAPALCAFALRFSHRAN